MLHQRIEKLSEKLNEEDKQLLKELFLVVEHARSHIEFGQGSYQMMRAVTKVYEPEIISLKNWSK
jgi:hypothetical protein